MKVTCIIRLVVAVPVFFFVLTSCKRAGTPDKEIAIPPSVTDTSSRPPENTANNSGSVESAYAEPEQHEVIDYESYWNNIHNPANAYEPFAKLSAVATQFIRHKDSLREIGAAAFEKQEKIVHAAIMQYKKDLESGKFINAGDGALLDLVRVTGSEDSSFAFLPEVRPSYFTNDNFFFLGGAPFIDQFIAYDTVTLQEKSFTGPDGKPELRLRVTHTENKYHFLKSVIRNKKPTIKVEFGGPVDVYDGPPDEVKGIGSVIHNFTHGIPVVFLTENGIVPGFVKHYQVAFTEQYACYSEYPWLVLSCQKNIDPSKIVGVYIPYEDPGPTSCTVTRPDKWRWNADLNNDLVPDIACVIGTYEGVESGVLHMLWFVNFNGTWKIIDYGVVPSCT